MNNHSRIVRALVVGVLIAIAGPSAAASAQVVSASVNEATTTTVVVTTPPPPRSEESTTTTTSTTVAPTTVTTASVEVLGEQVERPQVQDQEIAKTGVDAQAILLLGAFLLGAGLLFFAGRKKAAAAKQV